jgi:4-hydroxybenzoyl-CoA reductase alpha subunit
VAILREVEMKELTVVGERIPILDGKEKVTGEAKYAADLKFPHMLYGKILRSPHPHAKILNIDISKAKKVPGVKAVITTKDTPQKKWGAFIEDQTIFGVDKVRYIGEEVAAVAAVDEYTAEEALQLIKVDYEILPAVFDPEEAVLPGAPLIHEEAKNNIALRLDINRGDIQAGFNESDDIIEERFATSLVHQCYTEPTASVASMDINGRLTVWAPVQYIFLARRRWAKALDMDVSRLRVIQSKVGGGFGGKTADENSTPICCVLTKVTGKPVKIVLTREEEFVAGRPRVPAVIYLKMGVKKDGTFTAKEARIFGDNGAYSGKGPSTISTIAIRPDSLYRFKNIRTEALLVYTNKVPTGAYRGFGNPQMAFALESFIDIIADRLHLDPLEIRLKNAVQTGDTTAHGWKIRSCGYSECIRKAASVAGWKEYKEAKPSLKGIGVGIAGVIHVSGNKHFGFDGSNIFIKISEDGRAKIISGEGDLGQGANTVLTQIAAEELGIPLKDIEISQADTEFTPFCFGAFGSRVTTIAGNAVRLAAADAKRQLIEIASQVLEESPTDLICEGGRIFVRGAPERYLTIAEVIQAGLFKLGNINVLGQGSFDPDSEVPDPKTKYGNISSAYEFGAHVAVVRVCEETGNVEILDFVAAHDVGRAINPMLVEGQIEGGVAQGIGYALLEDMQLKNGKVLNPNFTDFKVPLAPDLPPIRTIMVETHDPQGPFGGKGLGEATIVPTAPAIANAIFDAVGVRIRDLPITSEKILKALKERSR